MFVGSQKFSVSWGRNFVGSKFGIICIKTKKNTCIYIRGDVNSRARVTQENNKHWSLKNNDDSTVILILIMENVYSLVASDYTKFD